MKTISYKVKFKNVVLLEKAYNIRLPKFETGDELVITPEKGRYVAGHGVFLGYEWSILDIENDVEITTLNTEMINIHNQKNFMKNTVEEFILDPEEILVEQSDQYEQEELSEKFEMLMLMRNLET